MAPLCRKYPVPKNISSAYQKWLDKFIKDGLTDQKKNKEMKDN